MPTFKRANAELATLAAEIISSAELHQPLLDRKVNIDWLFAFPDYDERTGIPKNDALRKNGVKALGVTRKVSLKDRVKGHGDAEITIDGDWWEKASDAEQRSLIDHELTHIQVRDTNDDIGRPNILLRHHDYDVGWFRCVAQRHGVASLECRQAARMLEESGQYFWPQLTSERLSRIGAMDVQQKTKVLS